ncbi:hypothetical protein NEOKW01_0663 [Nematocida sp. AWRm80]|nr:hypothetical protein NEOKW01_0663 [Nematocida sp. AWRm80]
MPVNWNSEVSSKLCLFHKENTEEYNSLLDRFNLYLYGYGYKIDMINEVFKDILIVDCLEEEQIVLSRNIYEYYGIEPVESELKSTLIHLDTLVTRENKKTLVLLYVKKDILEGIKNLRLVVLHHRELYISFDELVEYNYTLRDFSTFIAEREKRPEGSSKITEVFNVYDCIGPMSQKIFKCVLKAAASKAEFSLRNLFNKEKKKLLLVSFNSFREALLGFFDAGILIETNNICKLSIPKKDLIEILDIIDKTE